MWAAVVESIKCVWILCGSKSRILKNNHYPTSSVGFDPIFSLRHCVVEIFFDSPLNVFILHPLVQKFLVLLVELLSEPQQNLLH